MPKNPKKQTNQKPEMVQKVILFPADWIPRIDEARGEMKFSDFVRQAVLARIDSQGLSEPPSPGRPWPERE